MLNDSWAFAKPYAIIDLLRHQQDPYLIDRYMPLLAYGHSTIYAYDNVLNGFVKYDIELGPAKEECRVLTWEGIIIEEILNLWEDKWFDHGKESYTDEDIIYVGNLLGMKRAKEVTDSIVHWNEAGEGRYTNDWDNRLIDLFNARIQ
jgi:hypothetical protein